MNVHLDRKKLTVIKSSNLVESATAGIFVADAYRDDNALCGISIVVSRHSGLFRGSYDLNVFYDSNRIIDTETIKGIENVNKRILLLFNAIQDGAYDHVIVPLFDESSKSMHGGKREGSGRKKGDETKLMRIPVKFEQQVKDFIKELKSY